MASTTYTYIHISQNLPFIAERQGNIKKKQNDPVTDDNNKKKKQNKADKTAKYIYSNCTRTGSHSEFSTNFLIDASRNETETEKCTDAEHSTFQKISMQSMIIDNE